MKTQIKHENHVGNYSISVPKRIELLK